MIPWLVTTQDGKTVFISSMKVDDVDFLCVVGIEVTNWKPIVLGRYSSHKISQAVVTGFYRSTLEGAVCFQMPQDEEMEAEAE